MKRAFALEPFSRDHNDGLHLARLLKERRPEAPNMAREAWEVDLRDHFLEEERLLGPLAAELMGRLRQEHLEIEHLIAELPESSVILGYALENHIRWEERVLFPVIESTMSCEEEAILSAESMKMERRRWVGCPQRARLVQRRLERLQSLH